VLSSRNLKRIPRKRLIYFLILGLTSIPLHLLYVVWPIPSSILPTDCHWSGTSYNSASIYIATTHDYHYNILNVTSQRWQSIASDPSYVALSNPSWRAAYASKVVKFGDLYLAFNETAINIANNFTGYPSITADLPHDFDTTLFQDKVASSNLTSRSGPNSTSGDWIHLTTVFPEINKSKFGRAEFAHIVDARALDVPTRSRIQLSLSFMIVVIICNAVKLAMMLWVLFLEKSNFIVTLGDGAATFLEYPDPNTRGLCVLSKDAVITMCGPNRKQLTKGDELDNILQDAYGTWTKSYRAYSTALDRDRELGSSFM